MSYRLAWLTLTAALFAVSTALAQVPAAPGVGQVPTPPVPPTPTPTTSPAPQPIPLPPPPPADQVAATVNGQKILEIAVYRALIRVPPDKRDAARPEIVNFLVENMMIDQYLEQLKIPVDDKEAAKRFQQVMDELKMVGGDAKKALEKLHLTEDELKIQVTGALRWEKFIEKYAPEDKLKDLFEKNMNMFDASQVRAKHILLKPASPSTPAAVEALKTQIVALKKQIETEAATAFAKLPPVADPVEKEKARRKAVEDAFASVATKESTCPSKQNGGELGWFPRVGLMVEPFAKAAFALKPSELSDPVQTEFGVHLILSTDTRPGKTVKFEEVKEVVKDVYAERLRDAVLGQMRQRSQIQIIPVPAKK